MREEEVECELGSKKQEPDIEGKGSSRYPYTWKGERVTCLGAKESRMAGVSM